jgi:maleate isomerase
MAPGRVVTCVARVSSDAASVGVGATPTTLSGLRTLAAPPFLDAAADMLGRSSVDVIGYASTSSRSAGLSPDPRRIEAVAVFEWTSRHMSDDAEAVFIGGNGFRAAGAIAALEAAIERPVLTSNQVLLWNLLAHAGATFEVGGYGQLFGHKPPVADTGPESTSFASKGK